MGGFLDSLLGPMPAHASERGQGEDAALVRQTGAPAPGAAGGLFGLQQDEQLSHVEMPHQPTHRRYEAPVIVPISQAAIGYTVVLPSQGLHYVKLLGGVISLDAAGTLQFVNGGSLSASDGPLSGAFKLGSAVPFWLPPSRTSEPWLYGSPDQALGIVTTGSGATAKGWLIACLTPYDQ